ncbi:MAG: hypothetical protein IPL61_10250 [Myxococcales bacterium]|nr:hypothetical protein [Myxococcales bacterium]
MRSTAVVFVALLASAGCDDTDDVDGTRGSCASGGALAGCPDSQTTPAGACTRLVECGSYPLDAAEDGDRDWGQCVDELERMPADRAALVIACVASSTCDELLAPGSPHPYAHPLCFEFGAQ